MARMGRAVPTWMALILSSLTACGLTRREQLEAVAKDWCETIRASQVVPVYPLTQDIQPGDVFLVQVPVERQQELYRCRGFLPLDHHVARLDPTKYALFYANSFLDASPPAVLPKAWLKPGNNLSAWEPAPRAAFPSYGFTVQRSAGLSLAVPVKGVPVGLSLLGSDSATGSITISDARTIGIGVEAAWRDLQTWALTNVDFLAAFEPREGKTNYLRVVTRIYLTGRLDVQLSAAESFGGGLDAGAPKPVNLLNEPPPDTDDHKANTLARYKANLEALNQMLKSANEVPAGGNATRALPGGSVRVTAAAGRTISLQDTFDPPLVLGYLGFDCAILSNGTLGPPVATHAVLDDIVPADELLRETPLVQTQLASIGLATYRLMAGLRDNAQVDATARTRLREAVAAFDRLGRHVNTELEFYEQESLSPLVIRRHVVTADEFNAAGARGYADFLTYQGLLRSMDRSLADALAKPNFIVREGGSDRTITASTDQHASFAQRLEACRAILADPALRAEQAAATAAALRAVTSLLVSPTAR